MDQHKIKGEIQNWVHSALYYERIGSMGMAEVCLRNAESFRKNLKLLQNENLTRTNPNGVGLHFEKQYKGIH